MKILAFGEILWDIIDGDEHLGGAPFNFAAHQARCGNEAVMVSRVGDDFLGMKAYNRCREFGVDNQFIQWDEKHPTGTVFVALRNGQPDYVINDQVAYDYIERKDALFALPANHFDVFYFGSLIQRSSVSAETLGALLNHFSFRHIFYDVNLRKNNYNKDILNASVKSCTILKLNTEEVSKVAELVLGTPVSNADFCKNIVAQFQNIKTIVITASDKGCYVYQHGRYEYVVGKKITVKDAVGAGDAFSAAFMHVYTMNNDALEAATIANQLGAYVASQSGAIPPYSPEVKELLKVKKVIKGTTLGIVL